MYIGRTRSLTSLRLVPVEEFASDPKFGPGQFRPTGVNLKISKKEIGMSFESCDIADILFGLCERTLEQQTAAHYNIPL